MADKPDLNGELTGGCNCGAVRYTLAPGWRLPLYACHCTECQRRSGSACQIAQGAFLRDFTVSGELTEGHYTQPSGTAVVAYACSRCHTRTHVVNEARPAIVMLRAGTLDIASQLSPAVHLWVNSRQPWIVIPDDAIALETQPASAEEWLKLADATQ